MKKADTIGSIVLIALSIVALVEASRLPFGSIRAPQMGFFPLILSIALTISSFFLFGKAIKEKNDDRATPFNLKTGSWKRIFLTVASLFIFVFSLGYLGYRLGAFLLIAFLLRAIEPQKWWLVITVALLSSQFSYLVFGILLNIPLPTGILWG